MPKTLFVVDDSGTNLSAAEEALEDGYRVLTFSSASKMFAVLGKVVPDMLLLDIEMPEMDGFEALARFKSDANNAGIPVVFMTATDDAANRAKGSELGASGFIIKPFSKSALLECVENNLRGAG